MKNLVHTSIKIISINYNRGTLNRGSLISTYIWLPLIRQQISSIIPLNSHADLCMQVL